MNHISNGTISRHVVGVPRHFPNRRGNIAFLLCCQKQNGCRSGEIVTYCLFNPYSYTDVFDFVEFVFGNSQLDAACEICPQGIWSMQKASRTGTNSYEWIQRIREFYFSKIIKFCFFICLIPFRILIFNAIVFWINDLINFSRHRLLELTISKWEVHYKDSKCRFT